MDAKYDTIRLSPQKRTQFPRWGVWLTLLAQDRDGATVRVEPMTGPPEPRRPKKLTRSARPE